jgi:hypothetical protein
MNDKEKWYPGKYIRRRNASSVTDPPDGDVQKRGSGWTATPSTGGKDMQSAGLQPLTSFTGEQNGTSGASAVSSSGLDPVAQVLITIHETKYLPTTRPNLSISVEGYSQRARGQAGDILSFSVRDISSDIVISLSEEYVVSSGSARAQDVKGVILIPILSFIGFPRAHKPTKQWRQFYPPFSTVENTTRKYSGGLENVPDSALTKPRQSLGFVSITIQVLMSRPIYSCYLADRVGFQSRSGAHGTIEAGDAVSNQRRCCRPKVDCLVGSSILLVAFHRQPLV